jgi:hypothetical protein
MNYGVSEEGTPSLHRVNVHWVIVTGKFGEEMLISHQKEARIEKDIHSANKPDIFKNRRLAFLPPQKSV